MHYNHSWYRHLVRHDLAVFIGEVMKTVDPGTEFLPNWHIDLIAEKLQDVQHGKITRLIINMPPRSLKSVSVSVAWPAWLLGHDPSARIMAASYSASLALRHSLDCRQVIGAPWYRSVFPGVELAKDQNEKRKFMTTRRGFRFATSVGGSTTGEGGNFLILDDPINPRQAMNKHLRDGVNHWYDHTFASRLNDKKKGAMVLVMHRLHEQDLTGYLLEKGGWEHVSLPAVAMEDDAHRKTGEPLHKDREDAALIERAKIDLGSAAFAAQYQQCPLAADGNMLRPWWWGRYDAAPQCTRIVQSWDTAIKSGGEHDASVCLTFGEQEGGSYLLDAQIFRAEYPELRRAFLRLADMWNPQVILIEDKGSGQQLLQDMKRETHLPIVRRTPQNDKETRFAGVSAMIEAGRVMLPKRAPWLADFENELAIFPYGKHDDQVDALSQYLDWVRDSWNTKVNLRTI